MAPGVDQAITETMRRDRDANVRAGAIFTAGFRDVMTYVDPLADLAVHDRETLVRGAAVEMLGRTLATSPRAREALTLVAKNDPKSDVRKRAQQLLGSASPAAP